MFVKEKMINEIINMNYRSLTLLGYSISLIMNYKDSKDSAKDDEKINWLLKAVQNVVYEGKPLPEIP